MKLILNHVTPENYNCVLHLYPETRRAFLQVRKNEVELYEYRSSHPDFEKVVTQYLGIDFTKTIKGDDVVTRLLQHI